MSPSTTLPRLRSGQVRVKVLASGVFDLLHPGHIYFLEQAKKLGEELWVVVTCDKVARAQKRKPILSEIDRLKIISSLKIVDYAFVGSEDNDVYQTILKVRPDIIALGFDQKYDAEKLEKDCQKRGLKIRVVRIARKNIKHFATSRVIKKILERKID